jgi:hypothetical protein
MKLRILTAIVIAASGVACTPDWARRNNTDIVLLMDVTAGGAGGTGSTTQLLSDPRTPSIVNDNVSLSLRAFPKNPNVDLSPDTIGLVNDVIIRRYTVRYYRADGRNVEGVDVPYSISGDMNVRVPATGVITPASIIVVRHQAKLEPPLRNFVGLGGQGLLTMFADITVYGETITQKAVEARGSLEIVFIDFADE